MIKAVVFDLDGTLCKIGKNILQKNVRKLKKLESKGVKVVISSGKPTYYLCGLFRQVGLNSPIFIGENGANIQFGIDLPPVYFHTFAPDDETKNNINDVRNQIEKRFPNIFFQPNVVGLAVFPQSDEQYAVLREIIKDNQDKLSKTNVYYHKDAIDIAPKGIDKKISLEYLMKKLEINKNEIISVGDGTNDYPMFECTGLSYGVNIKDTSKVSKNFKTISQVLDYILENNV